MLAKKCTTCDTKWLIWHRVKILDFSLPVSGVRLGKRSAIVITERKNKGGLSRPKPASFFSVPLPITRRPFISLRFINWAPGTGQVAPLATVKKRDPNIAFRAIEISKSYLVIWSDYKNHSPLTLKTICLSSNFDLNFSGWNITMELLVIPKYFLAAASKVCAKG